MQVLKKEDFSKIFAKSKFVCQYLFISASTLWKLYNKYKTVATYDTADRCDFTHLLNILNANVEKI